MKTADFFTMITVDPQTDKEVFISKTRKKFLVNEGKALYTQYIRDEKSFGCLYIFDKEVTEQVVVEHLQNMVVEGEPINELLAAKVTSVKNRNSIDTTFAHIRSFTTGNIVKVQPNQN